MAGSGSTTYVDGDGVRVVLVRTAPASTPARLSAVAFGDVRLFLIDFGAQHVAFLSPAPASVLVAFATGNRKPLPIVDGLAMGLDEVVAQGFGEPFHVRSDKPATFGLIAIGCRDFTRYARALLGTEIELSASARFLRLPWPALQDIRRLHARAFRLGAARPALLARREVARALEQDLIHALLEGVGAAEPRGNQPARRYAESIAHLDNMLAPGHLPSLPELCAALDVPEKTLRLCCRAVLGCSPAAYVRLRQLNHAHVMLLQAEPETTSVADIAERCGVKQLGRFTSNYRRLFGESPSQTLNDRRAISAESA